MSPSLSSEITTGARLTVAAGLGLVPLGVAFGMLVVQAGLPWWVAPALSVTAYAGSLELLMVSLLTAGTPLLTIGLTAFFVNFRHVFYAFSFPVRVVRHPLARLYAVYAMTDEAWAITAGNPRGWTAARLLTVEVLLQCYWVGGGLVGVAVARALPAPIEGLEFSLCALFVVLALDAIRSRAEVPSVLLAAGSLAAAFLLSPDNALFVALILFALGLALRHAVGPRRDGTRTNALIARVGAEGSTCAGTDATSHIPAHGHRVPAGGTATLGPSRDDVSTTEGTRRRHDA